MYEGPRWFLDEDNIKKQMHFKDSMNYEVVANVLRIDFDIF